MKLRRLNPTTVLVLVSHFFLVASVTAFTSRPIMSITTSSKPLISPLVTHGRDVDKVSTPVFLATLAAVPVWAATVLPLSIVYQIGKAAVKPLLSKPSAPPSFDTGYVVDANSIVPREQRKYDVVLLGVTGFTGYLAAKHLAQTYGVNKTVKWAIAGRSQAKLDQVKEKLANELKLDAIRQVETIVVDTSIPATMPRLVEQTRCVATTAGPYALYGSSVVEFCAKFGTHYVDITGEVDWVKNMALTWQNTAKQTGAKIVPFCGHDSIPWDLLVMKMQESLQENCNDVLVSVSAWDQAKAQAPGGTFATVISVIEGLQPKPPAADKDPFRLTFDGVQTDYSVQKNLPVMIEKARSPWDDHTSKRWMAPFVMANVNADVVGWTHALQSKGSKTLVYRETLLLPDFKTAFVSFMGLAMAGSMLLNPLTLTLLKKFVLPKTGGGPSQAVLDNGYLCVAGEGVGEKGNRVECFFYFPNEPGCADTTRMMVESALCLALQEQQLPHPKGGVLSPAAALGNVLMERLVATGTTYAERIVPAK